MTELVTPAQTENELRQVRGTLRNARKQLRELLVAAAKADVEYRREYAIALLRAEGDTVAEREANALLKVENEKRQLLTDRKVKEAVADAAKEAIRALRDELQGARSENANVREASGLDSRSPS